MLVEKLLRIPSYQSARLSKPGETKSARRKVSKVTSLYQLTCRLNAAEIFQHIKKTTINQ